MLSLQLKPSSRQPFQAPACCAAALPTGALLAQELLRAAHPPAHCGQKSLSSAWGCACFQGSLQCPRRSLHACAKTPTVASLMIVQRSPQSLQQPPTTIDEHCCVGTGRSSRGEKLRLWFFDKMSERLRSTIRLRKPLAGILLPTPIRTMSSCSG